MPIARTLTALTLAVVILLVAAWWTVTQPIVAKPAESHSSMTVSPARLEAHVRTLSETLVPRSFTYPENLDRAAAYIAEQFRGAGGMVSEQPYQVNGRTYRNVIARFGPDTRERIVVGAHYDAAGEFPAADDNASGVAGLLELARLLGSNTPPMQVELVAYSLEEPPFFRTPYMGSAVHATSLKQQGVRVRAMFSLEMIGYFTDAPSSQRFPIGLLRAFYPSEGNFITVVGKLGNGRLVRRVKRAMRGAGPLPVHSINAPRLVPGVDFSDHVNYWDAGYDALMITDTAFYRNPNYHTALDTADTLDYRRMAMVVEGVQAAVLALAR
jgi:Zn-dependent M28 family amino/carboxypeptidase